MCIIYIYIYIYIYIVYVNRKVCVHGITNMLSKYKVKPYQAVRSILEHENYVQVYFIIIWYFSADE